MEKLYPSFFDELFNADFLSFPRKSFAYMPATNIEETATEFKLEMVIPGMKKEDIKVEIKNEMLIISGEREELNNGEEKKYTRKEYSYSSFERSFSIPGSVSGIVSAKYEDGVLLISLPKKLEEVVTSKRIDIV